MKFNKRGQAAVEYLIILAVVIIIALVVVGVLGGFPSLTQGVSERESAAYWQGADISLVRYTAVANGTVYGVIRNGKPFTIRAIGTTAFGSGTVNASIYTGTLAPGGSTTTLLVLGTLPAPCTTGSPFSVFPVTFQYTDNQYGTVYTFSGATPISGTCS